MQFKKLYEVAEVQSGLVLSRKEAEFDSEQSVDYLKLNLRSISEDGTINKKSLDKYLACEKLNIQFITAKGDIVIRLFPPFSPALITESLVGLVVPSQFAVIRLKSDDVTPDFLLCYLSHRNLLRSLAICESRQGLNSIKISAIAEVMIPLLPIDKQKTIASYCRMHAIQRQLYLDLIQQYDSKMNAVINSAIGGDLNGYYQTRY
ncbi:MAG TPA: hypothetical protein DHD79_06505 [Firmicutes bacterium]|jgi:hypothetical protein|nr:hypothetical protein [Bacillota bacterium]HCX70879.1 hypothetical protein [Bacillota bacterium]